MGKTVELKTTLNKGNVNKRVFWKAFASGMVALATLLSFMGVSGTAYAIPMAGVGNFYVEFDHLEGNGYTFYPKMGESSKEKSTPQGTNLIKDLTIDHLQLYKDFNISGDKWIRVKIVASKPVHISGLQQDASVINADAKFSNLALKEKQSSDWQKQFQQMSSTIELNHAKIKTHYLFQEKVVMNGMKVTVERINKPAN
ncbi:hypothetical protein GA0061096_0313 [Fictibacillus enclensis]|uniref:Uncharacterized protein n=1 Tax=Fictibacillus enclensis TaxID=1017270 RepID=A0A0V8JBB0_9BACL|nr:DUF6230 family protein [Fictibacillus enclensis]KSU84261.1 hypothetical protein AS030_01485 [Fictibacillus enclensis]SCB76031.1 hypothetical protein GA0061096_0313 [Fictibacillus enclensis]